MEKTKIKVVTLTYGAHGKSKRYAYLTDKELRVGQIVQPSVKHYKSGKIYGTTGIIQTVNSPNSKQGQARMAGAVENNVPLEQLYTAKGAGIINRRDTATGRFIKVTSDNRIVYYNSATGNRQLAYKEEYNPTQREQQLRNYNANMRAEGESSVMQDSIQPQINKVKEMIKTQNVGESEESEDEDI